MIGVIDVGIGGLTVVDALRTRLPDEELVYLGDSSCAPCADPRPDRVAEWTAESAARLDRWGAAVIVLASHLISCRNDVDSPCRFRVPVVDVATMAVQKAAAVSRRLRIGVVGSPAVVESERHKKLLCEMVPGAEVAAAVCPLWAPLVAEGWGRRRETAMIVKRDLRPVRLRQVDTLILASSYFVPLRKLIQRKMGPQVTLVDPAKEVSLHVAAWLQASGGGSRSNGSRRVRLMVSELTPRVQRAAHQVLGYPAALEAAS